MENILNDRLTSHLLYGEQKWNRKKKDVPQKKVALTRKKRKMNFIFKSFFIFSTYLPFIFTSGWDWASEMFRLCIKLKNGQDLLFMLPNGQITRRYLILSDEEIDSLTRHQLNATKYGFRSAISNLYGKI